MKYLIIISILFVATLLLSCDLPKDEVSVKEDTSLKQEQISTEISKENNHGIITKESFVDVKTTMDRLEKIISKKEGIHLFNRINHAENYRNTGAENVLASELIIFGNPKVGLKMLSKDPKVGLDLPLKILAYEAKDGKVYVAYRAVSYYGEIYNLENCEAKSKMNNSINKLSDIITKSPEDFKDFMSKQN